MSETLISQGFSDIEKERKLQYQWYHNFRSYMVRVAGVEPVHLSAQDPKSCVSANSTIPAYCCYYNKKYFYLQDVFLDIRKI